MNTIYSVEGELLMKVAAFYLSKQDFAEKLGINENQFIFGDVTSNSNEIEFKLYIDENAETSVGAKVSNNHWNVRTKLEDFK